VVRTALARKVGGFRPGFDGSQDHDLWLRVTEATERIAHLPDVLYSWRTAGGSAAGSVTAQPYAYQAAPPALQEALDPQGGARRGGAGRVGPVAPGRYAVRYRVQGAPLVSVVVSARAEAARLRRCLAALREKTAYAPYEVVVVEAESRGSPAAVQETEVEPRSRFIRYEGPVNVS